MGGSDSFFQDGLFLGHLDFLTTRSANQAGFSADLVQVSSLFRQCTADPCSPAQPARGCSRRPQEQPWQHSAVQQPWVGLRVRTMRQIKSWAVPSFPGMCWRRMSLTGIEKRIPRKSHNRNKTHCRSYRLKLGNRPCQNLGNTGVCPASNPRYRSLPAF